MKNDLLRIVFITLIAVFVRIICTPIFGGDPISSTQPFGNVAGIIGIIPSVIIMFIISYLHLTLIGFYIFRNKLAGNYRKGLLFGLLVGFFWLYGMFEAGIIKNISQYKELLFGISEAIPIILLGFLISFTLRNERIIDKHSIKSINNHYKNNVLILLIISITYLLFRYISYFLIQIESQYINKPIETFVWSFGNGIIIGLLYLFYKSLIPSYNKKETIISFCLLFFGIDWFLYNMFVPVFFTVSPFEIVKSYIIRSIMDIIGVCVGVYVSEVAVYKKNYLTTAST